jgi:hypothetical protein
MEDHRTSAVTIALLCNRGIHNKGMPENNTQAYYKH